MKSSINSGGPRGGLTFRIFYLPATIVALLLSGCAGSASTNAAVPNASTEALPAAVGDSGGLEGTVMDDELRALSQVRVGLPALHRENLTDELGRFAFSSIPVGEHAVTFGLVGYASAHRKVQVTAGEVVRLEVSLAPLVIGQPYTESHVFNGYIRFGNAFLDAVTSSYGLGCEKCRFTFNVSEGAQSVVFEILFTPTMANPTGPTTHYYRVIDAQQVYLQGVWKSRDKVQLDGKEKVRLVHSNYCGLDWICLDQRYTSYVTTFYYQNPPNGFTALPTS